ncbi:DUF6893 family small protein [Phytohabitans suffuscus]|uniref:Uncharacterized protein n=1 Tax=Phytohabitans suffuscus TaxID=624315 RepID=A0A6F8Z0X8_9ACTN|nr:hypothetical protein Psuf_092160 [Phytohabitans suffuscus]
MRTVGIATTGAAAIVLLGLAVAGVRYIPDIRRYLRIRSM